MTRSRWIAAVWRRFTPGCLAILLTCMPVAQATETLSGPVRALMDAHGIPDQAVSIWVQGVDEADPRLAFNADLPQNPASVMKLYTTYAALEALGPAHTWTTEIHADGPVHDGVLEGDLWIRGSGDPYLVARDLWRLLGDMRGRGIQRITGDLVLDTTVFAHSETDPGAFDERPFRAYNQQPHPLLINFNVLDFELQPSLDGRDIQVSTYPPMANLPVESRVSASAGPCFSGAHSRVAYDIAQEPNGQAVILEGNYPVACGRQRLTRSAMTPEYYVYGLFRALWKQWEGEFEGGLRSGEWSRADATPVAVRESRPLAEVVQLVNKYSNNVMARHLALTLAVEHAAFPATDSGSHEAVSYALARAGVDTSRLIMDNAAGLSRNNRVTARQVAALLRQARTSLVMPEFMSSLAVAGSDGTLRTRFGDSPMAGRVRMKTGSIDHVSAIAGYMRSARDEDLLVVVLVNAEDAHRGAGRALQDAVLQWAFHSVPY
ncbi:D-alanyl-D-alanine carboxypeptidase/D-alanyl-D-alanine-endopeptidase [Aquisalimonas sp. APHAB1-3]|uniref:D-alanyl-D-alanine carboxypeptidase/D-alanyl-D-alanine endopeptidase n=1 Tax=Aquisalimonas sp. APHAB1-3 TaxID=3402080 RepID=UPI003AAEAF62